MTLREFIKQHRTELDEGIRDRLKSCSGKEYRLNDEERRLWILNDEGFYLWARSEGVRL